MKSVDASSAAIRRIKQLGLFSSRRGLFLNKKWGRAFFSSKIDSILLLLFYNDRGFFYIAFETRGKGRGKGRGFWKIIILFYEEEDVSFFPLENGEHVFSPVEKPIFFFQKKAELFISPLSLRWVQY